MDETIKATLLSDKKRVTWGLKKNAAIAHSNEEIFLDREVFKTAAPFSLDSKETRAEIETIL